jgi:hypothetical protein
MATVRRTISFKPEVDEVLENKRGKKNLSAFLNGHFEEEFKIKTDKEIKKVDKKTTK